MRNGVGIAFLVLFISVAPAAQEFPTPDFNRELEVVDAVKELYREVRRLAAERDERGYADLCGLSVRALDDRIEIYGVPPKDELKRAWTTCHEVYKRLRPAEDPAIRAAPTPEIELNAPGPGERLDTPPGYLEKPAKTP